MWKIDAATGGVVATVGVGDFPRGVAFDGAHIWVANYNGGSVSKIDAATGGVVGAPIAVGVLPRGVAFDERPWCSHITTVCKSTEAQPHILESVFTTSAICRSSHAVIHSQCTRIIAIESGADDHGLLVSCSADAWRCGLGRCGQTNVAPRDVDLTFALCQLHDVTCPGGQQEENDSPDRPLG